MRLDKENKEYEEFIGIADTDGLDCFGHANDETIHLLMMRARFNAHRRPLVFQAFLTIEDAKIIRSLGDNRDALEYIKKHAAYLGAVGHDVQEHWDSLPYYPSRKTRPIKRDDLPIKQLNLNFKEEIKEQEE